MKRDNRPWKETAISFAAAKAVMFDGPGDEVMILVRGTRAAASQRKAKRRVRAR